MQIQDQWTINKALYFLKRNFVIEKMFHINFATGGINYPFEMTRPEGKKEKQSKEKAFRNALNVEKTNYAKPAEAKHHMGAQNTIPIYDGCMESEQFIKFTQFILIHKHQGPQGRAYVHNHLMSFSYPKANQVREKTQLIH